MKPYKKYLMGFIIPLLTTAIYSQNSTARYLLWQPSARSYAMGGVGNAITENSFAVYYNPAGLAFVKGINLASSYVKPFPFFNHTHHSLTALSVSFVRLGTFALSINRFWRERQIWTEEDSPEAIGIDGEKTNFFKPTHWEAKFSYATFLKENISIGLNLSLLRMKLSEIHQGEERKDGKTGTVLLGAGFLIKNVLPKSTLKTKYSLNNTLIDKIADRQKYEGISFGLALLNAGTKITFIDNARNDNPPTVLVLGVAYWLLFSDHLSILLSTDLEKQIFESSGLNYIHLGNELRLFRLFSVRMGYFLDTFKQKTSYFTFGGGVNLKFLSINLARYKRSLLPTWHFDGTISLEI
jgi:hypothetical protein